VPKKRFEERLENRRAATVEYKSPVFNDLGDSGISGVTSSLDGVIILILVKYPANKRFEERLEIFNW